MSVQLGGSDGWFVLEGGGNWACVEGEADEWRAIASVLEAGAGDARFKRCAVEVGDFQAALWSPRNAAGPSDYVHVPRDEFARLAASIRRALLPDEVAGWCVVDRHADGVTVESPTVPGLLITGKDVAEVEQRVAALSGWTRITADALPDGIVVLADESHVLGEYSGRKTDEHGETWWINDGLHDGDDPPVWWLLLPPIPPVPA